MSGPEQEQGRISRWTSSIATQWRSFRRFVWNPEEKTVLGRGGKSWVRILIFYLFYYSFLAVLFAVSITIVLNTLDPNIPRFQTRLQAPGLSIQPRQKSSEALTSDIIFKVSDRNSYEKYITQLDTFLKPYRDQPDEKFKDCPDVKVDLTPLDEENLQEVYEQACRFDVSGLGECKNNASDYGYSEGKPCILVKVNRIINWFPVGYTQLSMAGDNPVSKAPTLSEALKGRSVSYDPRLMYVACYGVKEGDQRNLNGEAGVSNQTAYFPNPGGIPFKFYPYLGNNRNPNYISPLVAAKFNNVQRGVEISVNCKVYARNIVDDDRMQVGYYNFKIQIDE